MAKKKKKGEQMALIEVGPENEEEILEAVQVYKDYQKQRLFFLKKEVAQKAVVLKLVEKAELQRLQDGKIRFLCGGNIVEIEPRDDLIKIKKAKPAKQKKDKKAK